MINSENEILQYIEENDVKFVKLAFCDINGKLKNISILSSEMASVFRNGVKVTGKKINGFSVAQGRDLYLFPDAQTMCVLPWRPQQGRVIRMFCYIKYEDGTPFEGDGRFFLKQAMKRAVRDGYCFRFGTSSEFILFRCDRDGLPTKNPHDYAGYCDTAPEDKGENFRRDVCLTLEQMGIHPVSSRHQTGAGQHEIDFNSSSALKAADSFLSFKSVVKSIADNHGVHASFMPKPVKNECGNGMHISMSLFPDNDFSSETTSDEDTEMAVKSAAAGILSHICEMTVFTNSIINSYSRLGEFLAPRFVTWSDIDEDQLIRMSGGDAPMVLRAPDCICNPYYVLGLMIYAALDGIEKKLELPAKYDSELTEYEKLPNDLNEAVRRAEDSDFIRKHIPETVLSVILEEHKKEWSEYSTEYDKSAYEDKKYFYSL